ncbi:nicotinate-nucleotide adenylyltransferase [uncultured Megasphaera sp.]|uniref:nicotinate-nucleotide adenylyltransferase n=1 Tax=uncultured Megasphaera sp. TaxID=165188 RepID=UPI0025921C94|nr:nicotinate-nucleotide adenylyltransferase [uncultured Megasphaera sp.]
MNKVKIGIMGGSFNPIHMGHLMIAEEARQALGLEKIYFVPSYQTPKKEVQGATPLQRLEMTQLATADNPYFKVSDWEIQQASISYTINTITHFATHWGKGVTIYFISGTDTIHDLIYWKEPEAILDACYVVGAVRPDGTKNIDQVVTYFGTRSKKIIKLPVPAMEISSTDIRNRLSEGKSVRYFLPTVVQEYIEVNGVYKWRG